ncbi:MAG: hypothetical protein AB1513_02845 [Pseudomonadota bacterium]
MTKQSHEGEAAKRSPENEVAALATKKLISAGLLDRDFEEIELALLGPNAWEQGRLAKPHPLALPQGSPLLQRKFRSVKETLERFSPLFWR